MPTSHDPYAAFRHAGYRRTLAGGVLASLGLQMQAVVVAWEMYARTDSAWMLGLTGLVQFVPVLLLALPAGQAADRFNRKYLFQLAQAVMAIASIGLAWLSYTDGSPVLMLSCLGLSGIGRALSGPARSSLFPQLVPAADLHNAVGWNSTGWQFASVAGPALGALLLSLAPAPHLAYETAAGCSLACIVLLLPVRPRMTASPPIGRSLGAALSGVRFVWDNQLLLAAITLDLFAVLLGGATALLPIFVEDILEVGPGAIGWLRAAPAFGAVFMALVMNHRRPLERPGRALLLAVAGFGLATIGFGLSRHLYLSFAMLFLTGAMDHISVVIRGTLMQVLTPDAMRGRVAAVTGAFISSSNELGEFESGAAAEAFGAVPAVVGGGVGTLLVVVLVRWRWPALAALGALHRLVTPPAAGEAAKG